MSCACFESTSDGWGPCFVCKPTPPLNIEDRDTGQIFYSNYYLSENKDDFKPNKYYYHKRLKNVIILSQNKQFTRILYKNLELKIPNKIKKYKGKKQKMYVHKKIFKKILIEKYINDL